MKHNEFKAFFKKKLQENLTEYDIVSIDKSTSSRNIFILDKETLDTKIMVTSFWGTNEYSINVFEITKDIKTGKKELSEFNDAFYSVRGSYYHTKSFSEVIKVINNKLKKKEKKVK